jgi:hypothetical protein
MIVKFNQSETIENIYSGYPVSGINPDQENEYRTSVNLAK